MDYDVSQLSQITPQPIELAEQTYPELSPKTSHGAKNPDLWLKRIIHVLTPVQKYSSMGFASFLGIHVTSVAVVPGLGIPLPESQQVFEMARALYQWIPVERFIIGSLIVHVASGIGLRITRKLLGTRRRRRADFGRIKESDRDDIGLGGITSLLGLGYRRSWISTKLPDMSPLAFSGYVSLPLVAYHYYKFRYRPMVVDGDSALVNLHYVSYVINGSNWGRFGKYAQTLLLTAMVWVVMYHWVSGVMRYQRWFSLKNRRWGYVVLNSITVLAAVSITRLRALKLEADFVGKHFLTYVQ